jgi:hypothetical protein
MAGIITPVTPWANGPVTTAMMNDKINARIAELQTALPMGPIASWIAPADTVTTTGAGGAGKPVGGWDGQTRTVTTARWLAVTLYNTNLWGSAVGVRPNLQITINGDVSLVVGQPVSLAGGAGILRMPATGRLLACPAGTVTIGATLRTDAGAAGNSTLGGTAQLQVVDYGAA